MSDFKPVTPQEARALLYGEYEMEPDSDPMIRPYSEDEGWVVQMGEDNYTNDMPDAPYEDAKLLAHATRALWTIAEQPAPQIIRTVEELEALDPETVLMDLDEGYPFTRMWSWLDEGGTAWPGSQEDLPVVVVATGAQVRAAREALGGA